MVDDGPSVVHEVEATMLANCACEALSQATEKACEVPSFKEFSDFFSKGVRVPSVPLPAQRIGHPVHQKYTPYRCSRGAPSGDVSTILEHDGVIVRVRYLRDEDSASAGRSS
jgi:hypothetical protein